MKNKALDLNWHSMNVNETLLHLETTLEQGLNNEQVLFRQQTFGKNTLPQKSAVNLWRIFFGQFKNALIYILLAAAVVSLVVGEYSDGALIMVVLLVNAIIGTVQEYKAEQNAANLNSLITIQTRVRRNGQIVSLDAAELVVGDIVILTAGNKVPADLRLIETHQLKINESLLTGESQSIVKHSQVLSGELALGDRINLAYSGSQVNYGQGIGVVVATGMATQIGMIATAILHEESLPPPLVVRMERFTRQLALIVLSLCVIFGIAAIYRGFVWHEVLFLSIALAVSAIPEGLPIAITVALSIATKKMVKRQVLVRKLAAVEGLGSCNIIASDKTGTLTVNRQLIRQIWLSDDSILNVTGEGYDNHGQITDGVGNQIAGNLPLALRQLIIAGCAANEAELFYSESDIRWQHSGDEVDLAFLALGYKANILPHLKTQLTINELTPYSSERKFSAATVNFDHQAYYFIKGAAETLLERSAWQIDHEGKLVPINADNILQQIDQLAQSGHRVLAVAGKSLATETIASGGLIFYGLVGMIDPLRSESRAAIAECHNAGIQVAMITGDHPHTALAIARELGIADNDEQVISGSQFEQLYLEHKDTLAQRIQAIRVFARVSPLQKMYIVEALYQAGNFVAVTGDGVNDVPALKKAHIGISMGSGSDLTKDSADLIVVDDNFKSIVAGVEEGRYAYDNIRKVTYLSISSAFAEIFLLLLAVLVGLPLPLTAVQLLWINLITNGMQDVALAFEKGEPESMQRPPRSSQESIFNRLMIEESLLSGLTMGGICFGLWYILLGFGYSEWHARTLLFLMLVFLENFQVFNCRSEYRSVFKIPFRNNYFVVIAVIGAQIIQLIVSHIPFMQKVLDADPVNLEEWLMLFTLSVLLLLVMEIYKYLRFKRK